MTMNRRRVVSERYVRVVLDRVVISDLSRNGSTTQAPSVLISCTTLTLWCWSNVVTWTAPETRSVVVMSSNVDVFIAS